MKSNSFGLASLVTGVLSITCACCGLSLPVGALGLLFYLLCSENVKRTDQAARTGKVLSIMGIVIGAFFYIMVVYQIMYNPAFVERLNETSRQMYGINFTDMLQSYGLYQ